MKARCPICKRTTTFKENPWKPFCSERCKLIDLGMWAKEEYKIAGEEAGGKEDEEKGGRDN